MKKTLQLIGIFLIALIISGAFFAFQEVKNTVERNDLLSEMKEMGQRHLDDVSEMAGYYNDLFNNYLELSEKYNKVATDKGFYEGWEIYTVTAYTSLDDGCGSIASTGVNIKDLAKLYNFAAVDPQLIPYGSVILVKFDTGIESFLAVDTGGAIKDKHIDLYFVNNLSKAFEFGKKELEVKIIR